MGGFHEVIELCQEGNLEIAGIIDNNFTGEYLGFPVIGKDIDAPKLFEYFTKVPVVITPDQPEKRKKLVEYYYTSGFRFCTVIHPGSKISKMATVGNGVIVQSGAHVSPKVSLGDFVKINTHAIIMHDCQIGAYSTIAPKANILGNVKIGSLCYIGAGAVILPGITIGDKSIVGAGAVVTKDVGENKTVKGNPAQ